MALSPKKQRENDYLEENKTSRGRPRSQSEKKEMDFNNRKEDHHKHEKKD